MKKIIYILFYLCINQVALAQISISGTINDYTQVINIVCNTVTVNNPSLFAVDDTVLIIQMKGATIDETQTATFGNINPSTNINDAGNYEFAHIASISGKDITFKNTLTKSYSPLPLTNAVQLISVPQYTDVTITGTLTAPAWKDTTGGVVVFEASGTVTLNANIDVSVLGFRGGALNMPGNQGGAGPCTYGSTLWYGATTNDNMGGKGEGIAATITNKESGRGKQANGGGGGQADNCGGGGGSNYGSGGIGGRQSSSCGAFAGNGFQGGGGLLLSTYYNITDKKIFLGGGSGAGHQNNNGGPGGFPSGLTGGSPAARGGGIVIIKANTIDGNSNSILANGGTPPYFSYGDGASGGGAGGTILLSVSNFPTPLTIQAKGGKGGDVYDDVGKNHGPGGGGGGGALWVSTATVDPNITSTLTGGASGIVTRNGNTAVATVCECVNSSLSGNPGGTVTGLVIPEGSDPAPVCALPVALLTFTTKLIQNKVKLEWTTANEKNNDHFIIERTTDFVSFTTIAVIKGSKNNTVNISYSTYDNEPTSSGVVYYRLSQIDIDGTRKNLGTREVTLNTTEKLIENIFPNPFNNTLSVSLNKNIISSEDDIEIKIYNAVGQLVYNSFINNSSKIELPLSDLAPGIYNLVLNMDGQMEMTKVLKDN